MINTTTDNTASPTAPVSHSDRAPGHGQRRGTRWARVALASTALLAGSVTIATQASANDEFEHRCVPDRAGSADSLERQALACQLTLDEAYVACMRDAADTPDSAERWVEYCQTQALG